MQNIKNILTLLTFVVLTPMVLSAQNCFECEGNLATGIKSFASGLNNEVAGEYSAAFGVDNIVVGNNSLVIGKNSVAHNNYSAVIGSWSKTVGLHSFVIGSFSEAIANSGYIIGNGCKINADNSVLIGHYLQSYASNSFIIGSGLIGDTLTNNVSNSLAVGFNSNLPSFIVGSSNGHGTTGRIGIGNITEPAAKLHIRADGNEDAAILLQPTSSDYEAKIYLGDTEHSISARAGSNLVIQTGNGNHTIIENGNLGIGTNQPGAKVQVKDGDIFIEDINRGIIMKSPDGNCWRGTINNEGMLEFVQIDCGTFETGTQAPASLGSTIKIYPNPVKEQVVIECSQSTEALQLEVTDMSGRLLHQQTIENAITTISSDYWPAGMYFFNFKNNQGTTIETMKVVKEN
jgi:hypothetical protein